MINAKKKGNRGENNFANWLYDNGIKAFKDGQSGGGNREKSDVGNDIDFHFEVKTVKNLSLQKAWRQAVRDSGKSHNTPAVVIHYDGMPKDEWLIVMDNHSWLELVKKNMDLGKEFIDPKDKYAVRSLVESAKRVLKIYNSKM